MFLAVTCAFDTILRTVFGTREERPELLMGARLADDDEAGGPPAPIDNGVRRLAAAVLKKERRRGCHAAPWHADGAAAADVLGRQPYEYVVNNLLGQVLE